MTQRRRIRGERLVVVLIGAMLGLLVSGAPATAQDEQQASAVLTELNDSGISGTAQLIAHGQQTEVIIRANGALGDHPTHIHQGSCDNLNPNPEYPLSNVELQTTDLTGSSDTTINVPLRELLASPHLILIHKSPTEIGSYAACGDIVAAPVATPTSAPAVAGPLGDTGTGTASLSDDRLVPLALGILALVCGGFSLMLGRRVRRP